MSSSKMMLIIEKPNSLVARMSRTPASPWRFTGSEAPLDGIELARARAEHDLDGLVRVVAAVDEDDLTLAGVDHGLERHGQQLFGVGALGRRAAIGTRRG